MISRRITAALIAAPAAVALAACGSSGGTGSNPTGTAPASTSSSSSSSSSSSAPTSAPASTTSSASSSSPEDAKGLYALLVSGVKNTKTAHIDLTTTAGSQTLRVYGDEKLSNGRATALNITESSPATNQSLQVILADGKLYAKLPKQINTTGKPYLALTTTSKDATVRRLATTFKTSLDRASTAQYAAFAQAADEVKKVGPTTVNGTSGTRYDITVNPSKLPADTTNRSEIVASGAKTIPMQIVVDSAGRMLYIQFSVAVQGKQTVTKVLGSKYNQPVNISAPPASQVGVK